MNIQPDAFRFRHRLETQNGEFANVQMVSALVLSLMQSYPTLPKTPAMALDVNSETVWPYFEHVLQGIFCKLFLCVGGLFVLCGFGCGRLMHI